MKKILLFILIAVLRGSICTAADVETRNIEAEIVFNLARLNPAAPILGGRNNYFEIDHDGNLYVCDMGNHRVIVFNRSGEYKSQIGSIGQEESDLYYPCGIAIHDQILHILDQGGKRIKLFTLEGTHRKTIPIKDVYSTESICILENGFIVTGSKYLGKNEFRNHPLVTIFDSEGTKERFLGKILRCGNYQGYIVFNLIMLGNYGENVVAAHTNAPRIISYDIAGKKIFDMDLSKMNIAEIEMIKNNEAKLGMDTPKKIISMDGSITSSIYCSGLAVEPITGEIYYSVYYPSQKKSAEYEGNLLVFNSLGKWARRINVSAEGKTIQPRRLLYHEGFIYGVGESRGDQIVFRFPCSNKE